MNSKEILQKSAIKKDEGLRKGESKHSKSGYVYRWTDEFGERHVCHAPTLEALRIKEEEIASDRLKQVKPEARNKTLNDLFDCWKQLKRGLKDNTYQNYVYLYDQYVAIKFGKMKIANLVKSDLKQFYNSLYENKGLSISTIDGLHTVLHQVLDMAVEDQYILRNPSDNVMKELKKAALSKGEPRRALTKQEQELFLSYLKKSPSYEHWYPVFAVMIGTGMRVGEIIGLRWCDVDLDVGIIDINHTLVYYKHAENGCYSNIHTPKTAKGIRQIPLLDFVKEAFQEERRNQFKRGIRCEATIDGYTDFVFLNRFGHPLNQGCLNKAIHRIVRDCNNEIALAEKKNTLFLPYFSCHSLRHTFTTRLCEAGVNIKVIQDILGHADVSTTLNIYTTVTKDMKRNEFASFESYWSSKIDA